MEELSKPSITVEELQSARRVIQVISDETDVLLKKNVYQNYALFIDTAREISYLKNEMFALSHLLSEQQSLFSSLQEISISGFKNHGFSEKNDAISKYQGDRVNGSSNGNSGSASGTGKSPLLSSSNINSYDKSLSLDNSFTSNPFEDAEMIEDEGEESDSEMFPVWLNELPEDLDVCIAQRNFEEAVSLVHKVNDHFALYPKLCEETSQSDLKAKINSKIEELVKAISKELEIIPDRPIQSGPRSARRAVILLIRLAKSSLATELFLNQRSAILRYCLMQQKKEGSTLHYIERMSSVFFNNVTETCKEFQKAFGGANLNSGYATIAGSYSYSDSMSLNYDKMNGNGFSVSHPIACLVSWVQQKLRDFLDSFCVHVFTTQVTPSIASECVSIVYHHCKKLKQSVHIDLVFYFDQKLKTGIVRVINDCRDKLLESIKHRSLNDKWQPQNYSNKAGISKFLEEMKESGLGFVQDYVYDEVKVLLSSNVTSFAKQYLNTFRDLIKLSTPFTHQLMIEALVVTFKSQLKQIEKVIKHERSKSENKFVAANATFLLDTLLPFILQLYTQRFGETCYQLSSLKQEYEHLLNGLEPFRRKM